MITLLAILLSAESQSARPLPLTPEAIRQMREIAAERAEKVMRVLAAAKASDNAALKREGVLAIPYVLGHDGRTSSPFSVKTLAALSACTTSRASGTGIDWVSVTWTCPRDGMLPWSSTSTAFRFSGGRIVEIQTVPGPPMITPRR